MRMRGFPLGRSAALKNCPLESVTTKGGSWSFACAVAGAGNIAIAPKSKAASKEKVFVISLSNRLNITRNFSQEAFFQKMVGWPCPFFHRLATTSFRYFSKKGKAVLSTNRL